MIFCWVDKDKISIICQIIHRTMAYNKGFQGIVSLVPINKAPLADGSNVSALILFNNLENIYSICGNFS